MNNWTALKDSWGRTRIDEQISLFFWGFWGFFNSVFDRVCSHFGSGGVENRTLPSWISLLPQPFLLCFHPPVLLSANLGLDDSENVRSDCWWCYCVSVDEGVFSFFLLLPSLPSSWPPLPSPAPVFFLHLLVVPVHSIRLEYGCAVVDTCSLWLVSKCCCLMMCCSSWYHQTRSSD